MYTVTKAHKEEIEFQGNKTEIVHYLTKQKDPNLFDVLKGLFGRRVWGEDFLTDTNILDNV